MDRGAWWATVHRVANSRTRLSDFTFFHFSMAAPDFFPEWSEGPSFGGHPWNSPNTWDMTILVHPILQHCCHFQTYFHTKFWFSFLQENLLYVKPWVETVCCLGVSGHFFSCPLFKEITVIPEYWLCVGLISRSMPCTALDLKAVSLVIRVLIRSDNPWVIAKCLVVVPSLSPLAIFPFFRFYLFPLLFSIFFSLFPLTSIHPLILFKFSLTEGRFQDTEQ